ncbi:MAG: hypothetical protein RL033_1337 [Pseudomonadota bacterium]|jgi:uncharacterized OsmC-like protein
MTQSTEIRSAGNVSVEAPPRKRTPLNGVDTEALFATINAVKQQPEAAQFQFRASNTWIRGTHSESRCGNFSGAGAVHEHAQAFSYEGDHPPVLCGVGRAPTPIEYLLGALACCLTAGIGNIAAARRVELTRVTATVEGDINLLGLLGIDGRVRNGYQAIRVRYNIEGNAPAAVLRAVVEQSEARSAVLDVLRNGVAVSIDVETPNSDAAGTQSLTSLGSA